MRQCLVTSQLTVSFADCVGSGRARSCQSREAKPGKQTRRYDVPRVGNQKGARCLMKRAEALGSVDLARAHDQQDEGRAATDSNRLIGTTDLCESVQIRGCDVYQFTFIANWNWRGSYAAVGCPAFV